MDTERNPLLSDDMVVQVGLGILDREFVRESRKLQHLYNAKYCGAAQVRDFYERLITDGKLRVVEEVELVPEDGRGWDTCSKCGEQPNAHSPIANWTYCPGCGGKIKRA